MVSNEHQSKAPLRVSACVLCFAEVFIVLFGLGFSLQRLFADVKFSEMIAYRF
jgi:hypothetical protein